MPNGLTDPLSRAVIRELQLLLGQRALEARQLLGFDAAHCLDLEPVGIDHERPVERRGVLRPHAWPSRISATATNGRVEERIDAGAVGRLKADVEAGSGLRVVVGLS
jgi:hypothetical protein